MRILYVSQYFPPEMGAPAARVYELAREWVRMGHKVTALTAFAHHPTGIKAPQDRGVITRRETVDGIDVVRTYVYAAPNRGIARRMASYASFMLSAMTIGRARVETPDVVIATSPQLLCAVAGYALARSLGAPFVFEVRDLWPESIMAVGAMGGGPVIQGLRAVARHLYRRSERIVTVGNGYARMLGELHGVPPGRIDVIPNGIDAELFVPAPRDNEVRREQGWGDRFVALYCGTHGMAHGLDRVIEAARAVPEALFAFVGEGAEKDRLKGLAAGMENVRFIDQQPRSRVPAFYAACDLGLVTLRRERLFQEVLPSKIFEYLGMERPIVLSVDGDARRLVEEAGAGEFVPPEDVPAMVGAIRRLMGSRERLAEMGRRGREYVVKHYDRRALAERYLGVLSHLIH